ncbi:MAG: SDR family oxidoreductase [Acidobacteria bacterium]|nr:SDR family oxidoreductase [Acidobacteriota bacterium]
MPFQVVTGGAGFIGSHIVERLLQDGEEVVLIDDFSTGREANIAGFAHHAKLRIERVSILDAAALSEMFKGAEFVFHNAAIPSVQKSLERPLETNDVNVRGTLNVLLAAGQCGVKRVVYASSSSIYGESEVLPKREDLPAQPLSPYALQKYVGELYARVFSQLSGISFTALRYFNVFGPRQDPASEYAAVIPRFVTSMLQGKSPTIYGDGEQSRDFTYVDNVVEANLKAARSDRARGEVINIALGERVSLNQLIALINGLLRTNIRPVHEPARSGDVRHSQAAVERARHLIGFEPAVDLREGLRRTLEWYGRRGA